MKEEGSLIAHEIIAEWKREKYYKKYSEYRKKKKLKKMANPILVTDQQDRLVIQYKRRKNDT